METAFVIDDHHDTADMLREILNVSGFNAKSYNSFDSALNDVTEIKPCIIFLDYRIPGGMTAEDFIKRAREVVPNVKVVMISGDARARNIARSLNVVGFFLKPFDIGEVLHITQQHCAS